jgi:phosphoglycolate phosphatase
MTAPTKFIVWDWNGTLLDDVHASHEGMNVILRHFKKSVVDLDAFREIFDMPVRNIYSNAGFTDDEINRDMPVMQHLFHDNYEPLSAKAVLRDGAMQILSLLKSAKVASIILSNHLVGSIMGHLNRLGIAADFGAVMANEDRITQIGAMTKGEKLRHYLGENNLSPENGIIIGDTPEETHIARELGLGSAAITGGYASQRRLETVSPDYLIHSLHELKPVLENRGLVS